MGSASYQVSHAPHQLTRMRARCSETGAGAAGGSSSDSDFDDDIEAELAMLAASRRAAGAAAAATSDGEGLSERKLGEGVRAAAEHGSYTTGCSPAAVAAGGHTARSAVVAAAANGDMAEVQRLLRSGARVDDCDDQGQTALIVAAAAGHTETVKYLLSAGADPAASDCTGSPAICAAAFEGQVGALRRRACASCPYLTRRRSCPCRSSERLASRWRHSCSLRLGRPLRSCSVLRGSG